MKILFKTIISSLAIITTNIYANNIEGTYICDNEDKKITLIIKDHLFDIIDNDRKLSSKLIPDIKNPNKIQIQLIESSRLVIDKKKEKDTYRLALKMSYQPPNEEKKNFIKKLGTLKKDIDGSLILNILNSEINCIRK